MFRHTHIATAVVLALSSGTLSAQQENNTNEQDQNVEVIEVSGIRASLSKALNVKRFSKEVIDSIVAEDIGKLPDNNVVESLQRVAGVQVTDRADGETNVVTIRGLTDVSTTVNGRTIFTASGRALALADIPSTLVSQIDVIKNRSASQFENGIAGQIDVHTFRPFDFDGERFSVSAKGIYLEEAEKTNPVVSALASNRWELDGGGEFGALLNVSYAETQYRSQSLTPGAQVVFMTENPPAGWVPLERVFNDDGRVAESPIWTPGLDRGLPTAAGSTIDINGEPTEYYLARDAMFMSDFTGKRERPAANLALQYSPNSTSEYTFEAMYNGFRNEGFNSLNFAFVDWWGSLGELGNIADTFELYEGTNVIKSRTVRNPFTFGSGDYSTGKTDSYMYALGGDWELSDALSLESELVYQKSEFESSFIAMRSNAVRHQVTADFSNDPSIVFADNPETPDVDESDLTDLTRSSMAEMYDSGTRNEGSAVTFTADGEYLTESGFFQKLNFGLRYDDRDSTEYMREQNAAPCDVVNTTGDPANCQFSTYVGDGIAHINEDFLDGEAEAPRSWAVASGPYLMQNREQFLGLYGLDSADPLLEEFNIEELNTAVYFTADFETEIAGKVLDGQIGARYVRVKTDTEFVDQVDQSRTQGSTTTNEFLPALALRYHLNDDWLLRFAYGETLRMPNFGDLNPTIVYNDDITGIGYGTANGGNAGLMPTTSANLDLSLEWYFGESSATYLTLFQRDIEGLVIPFRNQITRDIEGYNTDTFVLSQPDNASDGELRGIEFGINYFPENLPGALDGMGIQAAYTYLDSEQTIPELNDRGEVVGTDTTDVFGVSDRSYNLTLVYDREEFDARLAYVWRSDFLNNNEASLFANPLAVYRDEQQSLDFQLNYKVSDELTVSFDATNLTGEMYQSRYGNSELHTLGNWLISRSFGLGVRYSF